MAMLSPQHQYQMRPSNKEPEWSSICNNVFDEYLDPDDPFGFEANKIETSSSNDSVNLFDFSGSSEQSHHTDATSPIPSGEYVYVEARQPKAKEPVDFWTKTLRALEQNAAECERKQQTLRATKSHPDFLSLGGCPSPPAVPPSPTDQSFSAQRRVSRSAASGKRRDITARSVSRGRSLGVTKTTVAGSANPQATLRKASASPSKMMTPSRYRAGFKDVWAEKLHWSPERYGIRMPSSALPVSPPPSARAPFGDGFAAFGSPNNYPPVPAFDDQMSPLTTTFQQAHIHTPVLSSSLNNNAHFNNAIFRAAGPRSASHCVPHGLPVVETAPLYPERTTSLVTNKIQQFDFGFPTAPPTQIWSTPLTTTTIPDYDFDSRHPFTSLGETVLPSIEAPDIALSGLGISHDPPLTSPYNPLLSPSTLAPSALMSTTMPITSTHPIHTLHGLPNTPRHHRRSRSRARSISPSPPATEPRSSKRASSSRRTSRHRRSKSTHAAPPTPSGPTKSGFVNFTAQDSTKILSGVAPSGSSKTKARREKEAADKRRRLSQAAVKAVVEAGGDVEALSKAGLLI